MLLQGEFLQLLQSILLGLTIDDSILQDRTNSRLDDSLIGAVAPVFKVPAIAFLVILHAGVVVALVEVLEDGGEDLRLFVWEVDSLVGGLEELAVAGRLEPWRVGKNVFVSCEESLLTTDRDCDDRTAAIISKIPKQMR